APVHYGWTPMGPFRHLRLEQVRAPRTPDGGRGHGPARRLSAAAPALRQGMRTTMDPRLTPARPDLAAAHLEGQVQAARFVPGTPRRVTAARARLTARPDPAASTTTELLFGEPFTVYEEREGWAWGQATRDGYVGYLSAAALGTPSEATHWLAAPSSHIYPAPDLKQPPLSPLYLGSLLTLAEETPV